MRLQEHLIQLFTWRWRWNQRNSSFVAETPGAAPSQSSSYHSPCTHSLHFSAFLLATEITLYNAVYIWLVGLLWRLTPQSAPTRIKEAGRITRSIEGIHDNLGSICLLLTGCSTSLREPAIEIYRAFEFQCVCAHQNRDAALWYLFPVGLAYSILKAKRLIGPG
jgi:hypothetical protein